jgi:hypothetical protein
MTYCDSLGSVLEEKRDSDRRAEESTNRDGFPRLG